MQAVVKTPLIEISIKGDISKKMLNFLKEEYGNKVHLKKDSDDEYVDITKTDWYKKINNEIKMIKKINFFISSPTQCLFQ